MEARPLFNKLLGRCTTEFEEQCPKFSNSGTELDSVFVCMGLGLPASAPLGYLTEKAGSWAPSPHSESEHGILMSAV